jgi:hypothetical protein
MTTYYDKSLGPKEGKSSISGKTRKRIFGGEKGIGSFNQWLNQGGAGGPVRTDGGGNIDINTQRVEGLQTPTQPQLDITNQLYNPQQMLANMFNPQAPGGGQQETPADQQKKLQMLIDWMRESQATDIRQNPERLYQAASQAEDPVRFAQEQDAARLATSPWAPGGQFAGRRAADLYTPEEILASQGNTAQNQILRNRMPISQERRAQLAGVPAAQRANAGEFDPEELLRQNRIYANRRSYI